MDPNSSRMQAKEKSEKKRRESDEEREQLSDLGDEMTHVSVDEVANKI
jgi:hypothetical protein